MLDSIKVIWRHVGWLFGVLWHDNIDKSICAILRGENWLWQLRIVNEEQYIQNSYNKN